MQIHHLNCGTLYAFGFPRDDNSGGFFKRGHGVIHCLLVDTGDGLALVDTGWGVRDCIAPSPIVRHFAGFVGCPRDLSETAIRQVESLGYHPAEVKHIFLTHLHLDHAGGLSDFPSATIHLLADELEACLRPRTLMEWYAYRPEHRAHSPKWQPHRFEGDRWFGLDCAPPVRVGEAEFVMIPFTGHTRGHCVVALQVDGRWLLHCGDLYGYYRQVDPIQPYRHPSGRLIELLITTGFKMPKRHWVCMRRLLQAHGDKIQTVCAHDTHEFELRRTSGARCASKGNQPGQTWQQAVEENGMELTRVVETVTDSEVRFSLWVYCWDEFDRRDRCYNFKWDGKSVIFMFGGWKGQPRVVGEAGDKEEARRVAEKWLERWLGPNLR